jgi:lipopolysaccharide/colanic/teichoic acid biosynthesis glycosyltransferase
LTDVRTGGPSGSGGATTGLRERPKDGWGAQAPGVASGRLAKRLIDVVIAGTALLVLSLLIAVIAVAVKLESRGPVFYGGRRVGLRGREFRMLKFRKMRGAAAGPALTVADDERFTRLGCLLSRSKLDEVPQLWNVLKGEMSLVGPRPEDPSFVALRRADYEQILQVKPGITGLSQLAFVRESQILDRDDPVSDYVRRLFPQKIRMDRLYATSRSGLMDLRVLVWTAFVVLSRNEVAVHRGTGRLTVRRRPATAPESWEPDRALVS